MRDGPGRWRPIQPMPAPADESEQTSCGVVHMSTRDGCTVNVSWPCGQDSQPKPGCHQRRNPAPRGERRGLLVLTAGPVQPFYRRYPTAPVAASQSDLTARGFWPSSFGRGPDRGTGRLETMTRSTRDLPVRRRGELSRDRTIHRVSSAIDALRRLNARRADGTATRAARVGPSDPRYAHLPRSHD